MEEVLGDLGGEFFGCNPVEFEGEAIDGVDVGGMVGFFAFASGQGVFLAIEREGHVGGVGFQKETVAGDGAEGNLLASFSVMGEVAGEREVSAEFDEAGNHFSGATVGVEEKAERKRLLLKEFE